MFVAGALLLCPPLRSAEPAQGAVTVIEADDGEELEMVPPPPGAAAAVTGVGGLKLPADIKLPPPASGGLSAPGYLTAIAGNRSVLLSWYLSEGPKPISGYHVYRGLSPDSIPPQPIHAGVLTETNYSDSDANSLNGPQNRTTYYYKVRAFDVEGRLSPYSDVVAATPNGPLLPPGKLEASGYDGKVLLQWSEPISTGDGDLAGFRLLRGSASGQLQPYQDLPAEARSFEDAGLANGTARFYALLSLDDRGNTSVASPEVRGVPYKPLPAPQGLSALGVGDQAVRLRWSAPAAEGTFKVRGYNVYRSTGGPIDLAMPPVNKALIPAARTRYEDGPDDSIEAPKRGIDYRYAVVAVDQEGNPSPASAESVAGPVASLTKLETGEFEVAGGNTLQISGRKTIDASYAWVAQDENQALGVGALGGFQLDQQLQVRLTGKVGRKIKVDVDYDDKALANEQQKISVVYTGDQQEVFKEFAFGDILMDLNSSRTEFAGYNKSLFGAKLKLVSPDERLRITAVGAQTKGISETKRIVGGYEQARTGYVLGEDKQDLSFFPYKYYYLSRDKDLVEGPDFVVPGSVEIWLDQPGVTIYSVGNREVVDRNGTGRFYFIRLVPNIDFTVDSNTGLITFNRGISPNDNIAVAFVVQKPDGSQVSVGYDAAGNFDFTSSNLDSNVITGKTTNAQKMIQYGSAYTTQYDSHMSMQFYKLNNRDILNPQLDPDFKLVVYRANQSVLFQLDPNSNYSDIVNFDTRLGWMQFRVPFPFRAGVSGSEQLRMDPAGNAVETVFSGEQSDAYNRGPNRTNNFTVHVEYKYKVSSYNLRFGIIRGSEVILLDGRRLARDIDYFLDYDTGTLVFSNPDLVKDNSVVDATYEYLPFGGQFTSTIWGTRGEYDITKDISVGSTFLWNSADATAEVPDVRSAPYSLQILDGDIQARVPQDLIDGVTRRLPLLPDTDDVLTVRARAEMARSWFRPNTYGRNNESGVALIDSFEAIDNIASVSMERNAWVPSSRPLRFTGDAGMAAADRRFTRFTTVQERAHDATQRVANNENPNRSMAQIEWVGFDSAQNWDAYVYSFGQTTPEAIRNASYLEVWVKVDNPITLHFNAGLVDEDSTDNGLLDTESTTGILGKDQDIGFYHANTPGGSYPRPDVDPGSYMDINYWGNGNKVVDTEDLDANGQLDRVNQYYSFSQSLQASTEFQLIQIPLSSAGIIGPDLSVVPGNINYFANVRSLRFWVQGNGATGGRVLIESIQFKGNKWQVRADSNLTTLGGVSVTADTTRFQVNAINRLNNASVAPSFIYVPNTDFYNQETNRSDDREQSLQIEYALTRLEQQDGKPYYQARKLLASGQDVDASIYQKMRVDLYRPHETLPGERFLIRLGTDDMNYFEYQVPMDALNVGSWNSVTLALDGADGRRSVLGKPYLSQVRYVSLAIHTLNDNLNPDPRLDGGKQLLWVNNLRLTDAIQREGGAQRLGLTYDLMGGALVINHDMREVESDFVKMDQQAVPPQRYERSQVVDARLNAVQGVPLSLRYEQRERFTEPKRRDDPKYSRVFVDPDDTSFRTSGTLGFTRVPGLNLNTTGSTEQSRQIYLPAYIESQRSLAEPFDQLFIPNTTRNDLRLSQDASWKLPQGWWGVGNDELRMEAVYTENSIIFDRESVSQINLAFKNIERRSRTLKGRYGGAYKPASWLTISPSYAYTLVEAEGNIPIPTVLSGANYYDLGPDRRSDGWIPQSRVINPSLQLQLADLGVLRSPRVGYNFTQTRDYVRNDLRTPGSVDLAGSLNLSGLGEGWSKLPAIEVTQGFGVDSVVTNDLRVRSLRRQNDLDAWMRANPEFGGRYQGLPGQNLPSIALQEQQSPLQSVWWVRLEDPGLGENVVDPLHIENIATSSSRRSNTSFSTRFELPLTQHWKGNFSPRLSFRDERTMSAPEQITRRYQTTVGSGLEFREPRIPWWQTLKPSALTLDFSHSSSDNYVVQLLQENLNGNSVNTSFGATLPMRPTERVAVTAAIRWSAAGETSFLAGSTVPSSGRDSWQLDPALKVVYFLNVDNTWKMPDMWPFHGRELRIRQNFRLDNDLTLSMRREKQSISTNVLSDSGSDVYELINQLGYDVLDNVKIKLTLAQKLFSSLNAAAAVNQTGNYYSVTVKLGLEAIF
jgi:hypothetical protein